MPCAERSGDLPECGVVLPGSGSDEVFVRAVFAEPLRAVGLDLVAPGPRPGPAVVRGYRDALDAALAAASGPLLVGGISLGAHVAAEWAVEQRPGAVAGLLLALPAWTGPPNGAPAALAARATAALVRAEGLEAALAPARASAPPWLATELGRAWAGYGDGLAASLECAAATPAPDEARLRGSTVPAGIAGLVDDPVHPLAVARRWRALLPRSALLTTSLATFGADPRAVGRAAVLGWLRARDGDQSRRW
ncbi:MAG: alpha/beta hydrolase [Pseudonocardia sp. 73-21]|nr:MAG: alpha/beta hydrolase [Pseudonocardia sp. 73-21]